MEKRNVVAFDANPLVGQKTGVGQLTYELISAIARNNPDTLFVGHYFDFLNKKNPSSLPTAKNITYKKTTLFPSKALSLLRKIGIVLPFELFCRIKPTSIIFTNFVSMPSMFNARSLVCVYDLGFFDHPEYVSDKNGSYLRKWTPRSTKSSHYIITISEFTKQRIIDVCSVESDKILVIPVPPTSHSKPDNNVISAFGLKKYILFVGTLEPRKNILNLLDAYENLPKEIIDHYQLVLAGGKGWKDEAIIAKLDDLKSKNYKVICTGYVSDAEKSALYMNAEVVVQPSIYEGFGMPILEAMSFGLPVICSDIPVFQEIAQNTVLYFDHEDIEDISEKMYQVLNSDGLRKNLSLKSKKFVSTYPDWDEASTIISKVLYS